MSEAEDELQSAMNLEIAYELMMEAGKACTYTELSALLQQCNGNPWDVPIMHTLLMMKEDAVANNGSSTKSS